MNLPDDSRGIRIKMPDPCIFSFALFGGVIVAITVLSLINLALWQIANVDVFLGVWTDEKVINSILLTMGAGLNAVLILILIGTPLAYVLARENFPGKGIVEALIDLPLMLPHTIAGILVYILFMSRGMIGAPLASMGFFFEDAYPGIVVAMLFVSSPFYINTVREGFEKVSIHLENVSRTLGASRFAAFRTIVLPLTYRHIYNGSVLAWGRSIGEFAAVIMIAYYPMIISTLIYYRFTTSGIKESSAIAAVFIIVCFAIFIVLRLISRRWGGYDDRV